MKAPLEDIKLEWRKGALSLTDDIAHTNVMLGEIAVFWLGQAGFIIKHSSGRLITIDAYLTDCCERKHGYKRLSPKLIFPNELKTDILFSTHSHADHFDVDAVPIIMANKETRFIGSKTAVEKSLELGIKKDRLTRLEVGQTVDFGWVRFLAVFADHGDLAPDAIGILIFINDIKIYFTGDTAYRPEKMQIAIDEKPDIIILPINGACGNLNEEEAAMLVRDTQAKVAIPCHFWTFPIHGGNPDKFAKQMKDIVPDCQVQFLCHGEGFQYKV